MTTKYFFQSIKKIQKVVYSCYNRISNYKIIYYRPQNTRSYKNAMAFNTKDVILSEDRPKTLLLQKHSDFLASYGQNKDDFEFCMTEYLRMSGVYWALTAMELMNQSSRMPKEVIIEFITSCQDSESGGISASNGHDPHMLYTLSAVQVLTMYDRLDAIDVEGIVKYVSSLQQEDGSFFGDKWGEVDTRFTFCAVMTLSLLQRLDAIDVSKAVDFVVSCMNFDGGFGSKPGSESHAGLIYCCVGTLSICKRMDALRADELAWWLCERQLPSGGLNGRPEKLPDLCYSWWVMSSLSMLNRIHWVDKKNLEQYILACQDAETGGFSDRPGNVADPFHTLFGLAGLSLLGNNSIKTINPVFCMPQETIDRLRLEPQILHV